MQSDVLKNNCGISLVKARKTIRLCMCQSDFLNLQRASDVGAKIDGFWAILLVFLLQSWSEICEVNKQKTASITIQFLHMLDAFEFFIFFFNDPSLHNWRNARSERKISEIGYDNRFISRSRHSMNPLLPNPIYYTHDVLSHHYINHFPFPSTHFGATEETFSNPADYTPNWIEAARHINEASKVKAHLRH